MILSIICGVSTLPIWTTGYAIVEKETDEKSGTRNIAGINIFGSIFGPFVGIVIGSICIVYWEDISLSSQIIIDPDDSNWIGAWLGIILASNSSTVIRTK